MTYNEAAKGFKTVAAFGPASVWGTAALLGAGHGLEIHSNNATSDVQLVDRDDELSGSSQSRAGDKGTEAHKISLAVPAKYETLANILAHAFGTAATPVQQGSTAAYLHKLSSKTDIVGIFGTYVEDMQLEVHEYPGVKIVGWTFEIDPKTQKGKFTFEGVASGLNRNTGSGNNKTSTIASITMNAVRSRLLFSQMVLRMNDQSDIALASSGGTLDLGDKQLVNSLKISYRRPHMEDDFNADRGYLISEPHQNAKTEVTVTLGFSKYATDNISRFTDALAKTEKKMDIIFTGPLAAVGYNYKASFYLNAVQFNGRPQITGPGLSGFTVEGRAHEVASIGTGMPAGYTQALHLDIVNTLATNALTLA